MRRPRSSGWSGRIAISARCWTQENLDIVNIPTRTDLHAPLTIGVLEHRAPKAVIVEKPMATSLTDADRMQELAEANGTRLAIHHQMRTTPTFNVAERLISAGEIGPLTTIKIRGKGYYGGYDMLNIGTHMLNGTRRYAGNARSVLATCVTGGRPTTAADIVEGSYGFGLLAGEHISAIYEFDGGLTAFAEMHRRSQPGSGWVHIKIYGEDGALCLYNSRELFVRRGRDEVVDDTPWERYSAGRRGPVPARARLLRPRGRRPVDGGGDGARAGRGPGARVQRIRGPGRDGDDGRGVGFALQPVAGGLSAGTRRTPAAQGTGEGGAAGAGPGAGEVAVCGVAAGGTGEDRGGWLEEGRNNRLREALNNSLIWRCRASAETGSRLGGPGFPPARE